MRTRILYIISEVGWEYNDEYYYCYDDAYGIPTEIVHSREEALIRIEELTQLYIQKNGFNIEEFGDINLPEEFGEDVIDINYTFNSLTLEQKLKVLEINNIAFYNFTTITENID